MTNRAPDRLSQLSQSTDPVKRISGVCPTYERTDGRTENLVADVEHLTVVDAGRARGVESIGEVMSRGLRPGEQRHPVIRRGERESIPHHVRSAVWYRDHGQCELCGGGSQPKVWHLDHVTPWSAGGSDDTTNLRVLCETHNLDRSNRVDPTERPRRAATWWCVNCYTFSDEPAEPWWMYASWYVACPTHLYRPTWCRVAEGYRRTFEQFDEVPTWHERPSIVDATTVAYCAHCNAPGLTDMPL